jgi:hypothetical protein
MAGRGPAPKKVVRRTNPRPESTVLVADDTLRGPDLPDVRFGEDRDPWPAQTLAWWATWRRSPQSQTFTDTDWSFLVDTAIMHAEFWRGDRRQAAELRLRVAKFGATPEDRARLHLEVTRAVTDSPRVAPVVTDDPRARLKLVNG